MRQWATAMAVILLLTPWVCKAAGGGATVRLRQRAGVVDNTIRLSDLLPDDAPAEVRKKARSVELGRSPLPGSYRVFAGAELTPHIKASGLNQVSVPEHVVVEHQGWAISRLAVVRAISEFLRARNVMGDLPLEFEIVGSPSATEELPSLRVERVRWDERLRVTEFTLRCVTNGCGSFLVRSSSRSVIAATKKFLEPRVWLAKAGKPALLTLAGGGMRISLRVVCLERGALGQTIRVREKGTHREYRAEVVGAEALRAAL